MDDHDDYREVDDREAIEGNEEIGPLLRRLRGDLSLRDVTRRTGISSSYLSQIERVAESPARTCSASWPPSTTWMSRS